MRVKILEVRSYVKATSFSNSYTKFLNSLNVNNFSTIHGKAKLGQTVFRRNVKKIATLTLLYIFVQYLGHFGKKI